MKFIERMIMYTNASTDEVMAKEKQYDALEEKYGFPPKKRMRVIFGKDKMNTFVWEREWDSFKEMEELYVKSGADPELNALMQVKPDFSQGHREVYYLLED